MRYYREYCAASDFVVCGDFCSFGSSPETSEDVPAPQRSLLNTVANQDYNKPLFFDQLDNGVILPPMELEYDLTEAEGKVLKIGNVSLHEKNFFFVLLPLEKTHPHLGQVLSSGEAKQTMLAMSWPGKLISHGTLGMISRTGTVVWTYTFSGSGSR